MAAENGLKSLAFPSISTGAYGYPIAEASQIALRTSLAQLERFPEIETVRFVLFSATDLEVTGRIFRSSRFLGDWEGPRRLGGKACFRACQDSRNAARWPSTYFPNALTTSVMMMLWEAPSGTTTMTTHPPSGQKTLRQATVSSVPISWKLNLGNLAEIESNRALLHLTLCGQEKRDQMIRVEHVSAVVEDEPIRVRKDYLQCQPAFQRLFYLTVEYYHST